MLFRRKPPASRALIDGASVPVEPGETLLSASLRAGVPIPNSCRVGGCGRCRCRVTQGRVRELSESAYLLEEEELAAGTVLACQSIPLDEEVHIERVDAPPASEVTLAGTIVQQQALSHDVQRMVVQLCEPLAYRAGQFASLRFDALPDQERSYSFASPPDPEGRVEFFIRKVPGGRVSSLVHDRDLVGQGVMLSGPHGRFVLQPAPSAPLLMVAGGSGLGPILAILEDIVASGEGLDRPVTLLFGARAQRDLYALERIEALREAWTAEFAFVPVLSEEAAESDWEGARGLVTEHIARVLVPSSHAYLCGPPGMVDAGERELRARGVRAGDIFSDRFVSGPAGEAAAQDEESLWGALWAELPLAPHYLKFLAFHAIAALSILAMLWGGHGGSAMLGLVLGVYVLGDLFGGEDVSTPQLRFPGVLTAQLWSSLPLVAGLVLASMWTVVPGDMLGVGAFLTEWTGRDFLAAKETITWVDHGATLALSWLMVGVVGTVPAHELTHRTWDRASLVLGRWLLAFSFDAVFAIEHVYGHHRYVSTAHDPATAPRGRSVYAHILISTWRGNLSAWGIEARRLERRGLPLLSHHNAVLRGYAMSLALLAGAFLVGGPWGALWFTLCGLGAKALLEIVNYMEHYGMVRDPETPVMPRHSWNANHRVSSWSLFNLTRHSHHHAQGEVPFHALQPMADSPMMVSGYLSTVLLTLVPPLWERVMAPRLEDWDRRFATERERELLAEQGSGGKALEVVASRS